MVGYSPNNHATNVRVNSSCQTSYYSFLQGSQLGEAINYFSTLSIMHRHFQYDESQTVKMKLPVWYQCEFSMSCDSNM